MENLNLNYLENKDSLIKTNEGDLILDSHKLSYHYEKVEAWENGEKIVPVCVDMALTRACGAMCSFCYAMVQEPQERARIKVKEALDLADDFAKIGVKAVSLISDGESTLSKCYVPFIQHLSNSGIDVGNATNGWEWGPEKIESVLPHLTWVRFTVGAGTPESHSEIMFKEYEYNKYEIIYGFNLDSFCPNYNLISPSAKSIGELALTNYNEWIEEDLDKVSPNYITAFNLGKKK